MTTTQIDRKIAELEEEIRALGGDVVAAPVQGVDASFATKDGEERVKALEQRLRELNRALSPYRTTLSAENRAEVAEAYHRADKIYQMLGESMPQAMHGEAPIAYRRRLASGLRKYSEKWKNYAIHDALDSRAFAMVEDAIYEAAEEHARRPSTVSGLLREVKTMRMGKTVSEFFGDARKAWEPFMPPVRTFIMKVNDKL